MKQIMPKFCQLVWCIKNRAFVKTFWQSFYFILQNFYDKTFKMVYNQYNALAFDPIEIQTHYAPQNDRLNLSFLKDFGVVGKKMARKGQKMTIFEL